MRAFACRAWPVLLFLSAACGVPQEIYDTRVRELDRCHTDLTRSQSDYAAVQKNADELAGEASDLRDRITTLETDRMRLNNSLSSQKQSVDLLKSAAALADRRDIGVADRPAGDAHRRQVQIVAGVQQVPFIGR